MYFVLDWGGRFARRPEGVAPARLAPLARLMTSGASPAALLEGAAEYVERHQVFQLFEGLLQDLIVKRPDDPISHLVTVLRKREGPRAVVFGPPGAQGRALCELISAKLNVVHVIASDIYRDLARAGSAIGKEAKNLVDANQVRLRLSLCVFPSSRVRLH